MIRKGLGTSYADIRKKGPAAGVGPREQRCWCGRETSLKDRGNQKCLSSENDSQLLNPNWEIGDCASGGQELIKERTVGVSLSWKVLELVWHVKNTLK
jgi:hypothetical protein